MKIIVGLGNSDKKYNNTRHNVGFFVLDNFLENNLNLFSTFKKEKKFNAYISEGFLNNEKVILSKPLTYMNNSGDSVLLLKKYFNLKNEDICIIQDDKDLEFGKIKLKKDSGSGGHNGIKSIIDKISGNDFYRIKIGIKNEKVEKIDTVDFVLSKFNKEEKFFLKERMFDIIKLIDYFISK
ncbi:aminoacyl-tRNA hydrolase [Patescibacteria group bacterium]|nr:aminoacyl-tRNA hydrolase [Patescibacteria group bacterium]